jgi:hypothetical protein
LRTVCTKLSNLLDSKLKQECRREAGLGSLANSFNFKGLHTNLSEDATDTKLTEQLTSVPLPYQILKSSPKLSTQVWMDGQEQRWTLNFNYAWAVAWKQILLPVFVTCEFSCKLYKRKKGLLSASRFVKQFYTLGKLCVLLILKVFFANPSF